MRFFNGLIPIFIILYFITLSAQPSGGPYGPIQQKYELPKIKGTIYYVAPNGKANSNGKSLENPTTIESAIEQVRTDDAIILRGGVYRTGNLILNQKIIMQPFEDEHPVLKGTYIANDWKQQDNGLWVTTWSHLFPSKPGNWWRRHREGAKTPQHRFNNDMVFVDGKFLQSAGWEGEVNEETYYIDYDTKLIYIGVDPTDRLVEITAFDAALIRTTKDVHGKKSDKKGPVIRGITFTQYAYRAFSIEGAFPEGLSDEKNHGKEVVGTKLEHCTISYCSRVAGYFRGDSLKIIHCKVSDTSTEGIYIESSNDVLLEKNIFTRNNIERITGYYPAAVKIFNQCYRVTCNDNLVIDLPYSNGIWYDVGNVDGVFINNWIQDVGCVDKEPLTNQVWPSDNGFFFEISKGAVCAGNIFVNCDHGLLVLNSSNVQMYNNTFVNSMAAIGRNTRSAQGDHFGWHPSTGPDVDERDGHIFVNNLLVGEKEFSRPLLFTWQTPSLCERLSKPLLKELDHNIYIKKSNDSKYPIILWSPASEDNCQIGFETIEELKKIYPSFSDGSISCLNYKGPLFKSSELGNFQLLDAFSELDSGTEIPDDINKLLPDFRIRTKYIGAFGNVEQK
ncbi:MAG: right-handed parallel beta-helix repeat-containing protein [Calditrichaceae bacterium]